MQLARRSFGLDPKLFGKGQVRDLESPVVAAQVRLSSDLKLFVTTFAAGFLFVSILIG